SEMNVRRASRDAARVRRRAAPLRLTRPPMDDAGSGCAERPGRDIAYSTTAMRVTRPPPESSVAGGVDEAVARAWCREQVAWPGGVGFELAAEVRDVDVEVVRLLAVSRAPDLAQDGRLRQQFAFVPCEQAQQVVFGRRHRDGLGAHGHESLREVDAEVAD